MNIPHYLEIVSHRMDFSMIEQKLNFLNHCGRVAGVHKLHQVQQSRSCDFADGEASGGVVRQVNKEPPTT